MVEDCVTKLLDTHEIANLQGRYLYYVQAHDYEKVLGFFAMEDPEVSAEISGAGVYVGPDKVRALFLELIEPLFTSAGSLPIHMLTTPVIEVSDDGRQALGMWQTLGCNAFPGTEGLVATWQQGKYDNLFVKTSLGWRFKRLRWLCNFRTPYHLGWVREPMSAVEPLDLSRFSADAHPTRPSEPYSGYRPDQLMDFGPLPPAPLD